MTDRKFHAICEVCSKETYWGETVVSILRNVEQLDAQEDIVRTSDSALLATLCASCGSRFPELKIKVVFKE